MADKPVINWSEIIKSASERIKEEKEAKLPKVPQIPKTGIFAPKNVK